MRLNDRFVAYEAVLNGSRDAGDYDVITVVNLRGPKRTRSTPAGAYARVLGDPPYKAPLPGVATDLLLTPSGAVAWIAQDNTSTPTTYSVRSLARTGPARLLDAGPDVRPGSLAYSPAALYWLQSTSPRSSPVP